LIYKRTTTSHTSQVAQEIKVTDKK